MANKQLSFGAAAAVLCAFVLAGCGSTGHEPAELQKIQATVRIAKGWTYGLGSGETGMLTPAVVDGAVYAAGSDDLYKLDPSNGNQIWKVTCGDDVANGVGSDGKYVAVGTIKGEVEVYDADGKQLWKQRLPSEMSAPPLVGSGFVFVRTNDSRVTAFDAASGEMRWRYQGQNPALSLRVPRQMKFSPAGVLVPQSNGKLLALDANGRTVFDAVIAQPKGITEVERLVDVVGAPLVDARMICASAFQGNVVCMNSQNGQLQWAQQVDAVSGPVSDGSHVYIVTSRGEIKAFGYETGTEIWTNSDLLWRSPSAPAVIGNHLLVGDYDGYVHVLDSLTGKIIGRGSVSGAVVSDPIPVASGALVQTVKGQLSLIQIDR